MISVCFSICSLIYICIFTVVYFLKKRLDLFENKIYSAILITNIIGLVIDVFGYFSFKMLPISSLQNRFIGKIYLLYYFTWTFLLLIYVYIITIKSKKEKIKNFYHKFITKNLFLIVLFYLVIVMLPLYIKKNKDIMYSYGPSVDFIYMFSLICIIVMVTCLVYNIKTKKMKKYIPVFAFIIIGFIAMVIQKYNPSVLLLITCESIVTSIMYFTIENPDLQFVEELLKNRELTQEQIEDKSNFLFEVTQEVKKPLHNITSLANLYSEKNKYDENKNIINLINKNSKDLLFTINNVLDISSFDVNNIKLINEEYNTSILFKEIEKRFTLLSNNNIKCNYSINNVPEKLYGDSVRLKQIIMSVILNSIKYTKQGFIDVKIYGITRYDVCRLIIKINDSGSGMNISKINEILNQNNELSEKDIIKLNKIDVDLKDSVKIIKLLGGSFNIDSQEQKGTQVTIVIDQKCDKKQDEKIINQIKKYDSNIFGRKNVLIVDDNEQQLNQIRKILKNYNLNTRITMSAKDCEDMIFYGADFDLIIIKDELSPKSALQVLKEIKNYKIPIAVILDDRKEELKNDYIREGFKDYIIESNLKKDLISIINKL